jgi:ankyrin repeat protein
MWACREGLKDVVILLINKGANMEDKDNEIF